MTTPVVTELPRKIQATTPDDFADSDAEQVNVDLLRDAVGDFVDGREDNAAEGLSRLVDRRLEVVKSATRKEGQMRVRASEAHAVRMPAEARVLARGRTADVPEFSLVSVAEMPEVRRLREELYPERYRINPAARALDVRRDAAGFVFLARVTGVPVATARLLPVQTGASELDYLGILPSRVDRADATMAEGGCLAACRRPDDGPGYGLMMQVYLAAWALANTELRHWIAWSRVRIVDVHTRVGARIEAGPLQVPALGSAEIYTVGGDFSDLVRHGRSLGIEFARPRRHAAAPQPVARPKGASRSLGDLLRESARRDRCRIAIRAPGSSLTYGELEDRARALATHLTAGLGMARGDRLALILPNGIDWAVAFFASAFAGVTTVPIDPRIGERECRQILRDCAATAAVTTAPRWELLRHAGLPDLRAAVLLDDRGNGHETRRFADLTQAHARPSRPAAVDDCEPAAIFYTSGSTGRPKGVVLTHANIVRAARNVQDCLNMTSSSVSLVVAPFSHVIGCNAQLVATILAAGRVDVLPQFEPDAVLRWIEEHRVTIFVGVPTMYQLLLERLAEQRYELVTLRHCAYGGAPCPVELVRALRAALPAVRLCNGYGLTETSSLATFLPDGLADHKPASVGWPCPGNEVRIVDVKMRDVAPGEVGQLLIRGPSVFAGYWNDDASTSEALRDGWLHSGDLAWRDADGCIYVVDRIKDMIIRGGENVYCVEVEQVLQGHPAVAEAALIGVPDPVMGEEGTAFVVLKRDMHADPDELRLLCRRQLTRFKVPKSIVLLDAPLPRNATGKVLKTQLRARAAA